MGWILNEKRRLTLAARASLTVDQEKIDCLRAIFRQRSRDVLVRFASAILAGRPVGRSLNANSRLRMHLSFVAFLFAREIPKSMLGR